MSRQTDLAFLRRYSVIAWCTSLLVAAFGVVSLLLFVHPSLMGVEPSSAASYRGSPIWLALGGLLLAFGIVVLITAYRWPRRLLHVLRTQIAKPMRLQVEVEDSSDSTQYYALITDDSVRSNPRGWRAGLWAPSGNTRELVGHELTAMVYLDPQTVQPAVIEHADGYLWAMKGAVTPVRGSTPHGGPITR